MVRFVVRFVLRGGLGIYERSAHGSLLSVLLPVWLCCYRYVWCVGARQFCQCEYMSLCCDRHVKVCGHGSVLLLEIGGVFVLCCQRGVMCWDGSFFVRMSTCVWLCCLMCGIWILVNIVSEDMYVWLRYLEPVLNWANC